MKTAEILKTLMVKIPFTGLKNFMNEFILLLNGGFDFGV